MNKPSKPTPEFPLYAHSRGQWAKKIKGQTLYYGPWDDPQGALDRYQSSLLSVPSPTQPVKADKVDKPKKPRKNFPLYAHASGRWAKSVRGKTRYFGTWDDSQGALEVWLAQKDDLLAGREPSTLCAGLSVSDLVNMFLESKELLVATGELTQRSWDDYHTIGGAVIKKFGNRSVTDLHAADFEKLKKEFTKGIGKNRRGHGLVSLSNDIARARVIFNYAYKQGLIEKPLVFGDGFKKPKPKALRRERRVRGKKMFSASQIRAMLTQARPQLSAMILLGINCGFGNNDCATLPISALDLERGWVTHPRPKTEVNRRCRLWPETVKALQEVLANRPQVPFDAVFVTKYSQPWTPKSKRDDPIGKEMSKLLNTLGFKRPGLGFYALRHTFATIAGDSKDQMAVEFIMGHAPRSDDMAAVYQEKMKRKRLAHVVAYVRRWLFNSTTSLKAVEQREPVSESCESPETAPSLGL